MKKYIQLALFIFAIVFNIEANSINKPVSAQYGFIENKGQIIDQNNIPNPNVLYLYNGNGLRVQLRKEGFSYEVIKTVKTPKTIIDEKSQGKFDNELDSFDITYLTHRVDINFKDGNKNTVLKPYQPVSDFINYYTTGTSEAGVTNVHHFKKIVYENVYPNIDIEFVLNDVANCGKFKYNFIVKPNANLADIKLEFLGANRTSLNQEGNIIIETTYGNIEENIPLSYVINNNNSHSTIKANFIAFDNNIYGIKAENYNHNQTLVIDPTNWATYYGGSGSDYGNGIATDTSGNCIITGYTTSTTSIATNGAYQTIYGGVGDAFTAKFNVFGTRLWGTYYGGSSYDEGRGITIDKLGSVLISGSTTSTSGIATTGSYQTTLGGGYDAFIAKFNTLGARIWSTYYGGTSNDQRIKIKADTSGNIIITGITSSTSGIASLGAHQTILGGNNDAFIVKFNSNGVRQWATYYGGDQNEGSYGISILNNGNIIITGNTLSTTAIATVGSHQATKGGFLDAYIAVFNTNGVRQWSTYFGANQAETADCVTTDATGNIFIVGFTTSDSAIATTGSHQTTYGGNGDAFIAKFNSSGVRQWATYYGGSADDYGEGILTDNIGNIIIVGETKSGTAIATSGVYKSTISAGQDGYIVKFNASGVRQWATYYGGNSDEYIRDLTTDNSGNIIITGESASISGIATSGAHQTTYGGGSYDAFITKFNTNGILPVKLISFNATLANEKVNCTWETASEINNDYFTLEKSKDGRSFEAVGNVKGQGNSNRNIRYNYTDNNPFGGISYYRLKQTDFDGKYTYSTIVKVGLTEKLTSEIYLYYENNTPIIKINSLVENNAIVEIINLNGTKLLSNEQPIISGENTFAINGNITTGLYLLKVQVEDEVKYFKVWIR
jgi:predicted SpoU family rRNA methylase